MSDKKQMVLALRNAIMTEIKGQQLYSHAAATTENAEAKLMFDQLAKDENEHVDMLQTQYKHLEENGRLDLSQIQPGEVDHGAGTVIDDKFRKSLGRGKFELAVVGIGCDLENKAISYYKEQAAITDDADLKQLFTWLAEWEEGHLAQLIELEKLMQDEYWADQGFSPM